MEKVVKCRKDYVCCQCLKPILKGKCCSLYKGRHPTYDDDDLQIGIEYITDRLCGECCDLSEVDNE